MLWRCIKIDVISYKLTSAILYYSLLVIKALGYNNVNNSLSITSLCIKKTTFKLLISTYFLHYLDIQQYSSLYLGGVHTMHDKMSNAWLKVNKFVYNTWKEFYCQRDQWKAVCFYIVFCYKLECRAWNQAKPHTYKVLSIIEM